MSYMWLVLICCIFADAQNERWEDPIHTGEQCKYVEYEAAKEINIDRIPSYEAQVPTTVLMDMFGKDISKKTKNMDLGANGWMHFQNFALGLVGGKAPVLGPFLGCMGVAFGALNRELNTIKPEQLINSVNVVIGRIIEGVNRQFENMEAMFHQEFNKRDADKLRDMYDGKMRQWADCLKMDTDDSDECQKDVAHDMVGDHYFFIFQHLFGHDRANPNDQKKLSDNEVKTLETMLPLVKIWSELHISAYAVLVKRFENVENSNDHNLFYDQMNIYGEKYTAYMEWAVQKIKTNRYLNQIEVQNFTCPKHSGPTHKEGVSLSCYGKFSCRKLKKMEQTCQFKCTSMSPAYCDQSITLRCNNGCYLSSGMVYDDETKASLSDYQLRMRISHEYKARETCKTYQESLQPDVDNYWYKNIEFFLPDIRDILNNPGSVELLDEDDIDVRQSVAQNNDGSGELSEEEKQFEAMKSKVQMEDKAIEEMAMQGITSTTTMSEYFAKLIENTSEERKKRKKELKKQKKNRAKKMKKKRKIGQ